MLKTEDIKRGLIFELENQNVKDCGYDCFNGRQYVELRNVVFEADRPQIFETIHPLERMTDEWYEENYDPLLDINGQLDKAINSLINNKMSRHGVIFMGSPEEHDHKDFICTMYMNISIVDDCLEYVVHMRSNDVIEFDTDLQWHLKVYAIIYKRLWDAGLKVSRKNIIWAADTIHLYQQFWEDAKHEKLK